MLNALRYIFSALCVMCIIASPILMIAEIDVPPDARGEALLEIRVAALMIPIGIWAIWSAVAGLRSEIENNSGHYFKIAWINSSFIFMTSCSVFIYLKRFFGYNSIGVAEILAIIYASTSIIGSIIVIYSLFAIFVQNSHRA